MRVSPRTHHLFVCFWCIYSHCVWIRAFKHQSSDDFVRNTCTGQNHFCKRETARTRLITIAIWKTNYHCNLENGVALLVLPVAGRYYLTGPFNGWNSAGWPQLPVSGCVCCHDHPWLLHNHPPGRSTVGHTMVKKPWLFVGRLGWLSNNHHINWHTRFFFFKLGINMFGPVFLSDLMRLFEHFVWFVWPLLQWWRKPHQGSIQLAVGFWWSAWNYPSLGIKDRKHQQG